MGLVYKCLEAHHFRPICVTDYPVKNVPDHFHLYKTVPCLS